MLLEDFIDGTFPPGDSAIAPLSLKLSWLPLYLGLFVTVNLQAKKIINKQNKKVH